MCYFKVKSLLILLLFMLGTGACKPSPEKSEGRPNVLLLTIDTLRADHMGSYGYSRNTSPNIDRLAKDGVLFRNAFCNWPKTTPSFASILTGTYGRTNRVRGGCKRKLPLKLTTIAEVLEKNNYRTASVVKNANLGREFQFDQGFQEVIEIWKEPKPTNCVTVTDYALSWLRKNKEHNFFLWVHYVSPHTFYAPVSPFNKMFVNDEVARNFPDKILKLGNTYRDGIHRKNAYLKPHQNLAYYISQYDGEIAFVDSQVKRLLNELRELDLFDDTLIIFTSDHGEELGEHQIYFEHGRKSYQTTMHVPLIISYPRNIPAGKTIDDNLVLVDLFPTILEYCGIEHPSHLEGNSLKSLINGEARKGAVVFSEGGYLNRSTHRYHSVVYENNWKLIHSSGNEWELYDLNKDPREQENVFSKQGDIAKRLYKLLSSWEKKGLKVKDQENTQVKSLSEETKEELKALGYVD